MVETELAWAAGFFDGEGTTAHAGGRRVVARIVQATDQPSSAPQTLERFKRAVGVGRVRWARSKDERRKEQWVYAAERRSDVELMFSQLWPYLSNPKRDQANRAFEKADAYDGPGRGSYPHERCKRGHVLAHTRHTTPSGGTYCRTCNKERSRTRYAQSKLLVQR